jgi:hypothetical protein
MELIEKAKIEKFDQAQKQKEEEKQRLAKLAEDKRLAEQRQLEERQRQAWQEQQKKLQEQQQLLEEEKRLALVTPDVGFLNPMDLKLDQYGKMGNMNFRVVQVISPVEMHILPGLANNLRTPTKFLICVQSYSTSGIVDDQWIKLPEVFKVTGTKTYETVIGGSRTIFVIQPETEQEKAKRLRMEAFRRQFRQDQEKIEQEKATEARNLKVAAKEKIRNLKMELEKVEVKVSARKEEIINELKNKEDYKKWLQTISELESQVARAREDRREIDFETNLKELRLARRKMNEYVNAHLDRDQELKDLRKQQEQIEKDLRN